jgi:hypothetical protein
MPSMPQRWSLTAFPAHLTRCLEHHSNEMDWRSLVHRSARAQLSSAVNCALQVSLDTARNGRAVELSAPHRRAGAGDGAGEGKAWRCGWRVFAAAWHGYQLALPLVGPVRSDRSQNAATRDGDTRRRRREGARALYVADLVRPPDRMTAIRTETARSRRDGAASSPCAARSIGKLQRATARNLAIQLQRPTWHLCWTSVAARNPEDTALSVSASPPSLARIGPLRIVHEQHRELGTGGSSVELSRSQ